MTVTTASKSKFGSLDAIKGGLTAQQYIASDEIATTVFLTQTLGKPLLCEGPAGVGKTELAKAIEDTKLKHQQQNLVRQKAAEAHRPMD